MTDLDGLALALPWIKIPPTDGPFRGIEPFRPVDAAIFPARREAVNQLFRTLVIYRGVLLYGDSGAGKSSLVNAGLIPLAVREAFLPERIRVQPIPGEELIIERIGVGIGGSGPYLPSVFSSGPDSPSRIVVAANELCRILRSRGNASGPHPLLIFDQFEEFVTLFEEAPRGNARSLAVEAQAQIVDALSELLHDQIVPAKCLLVFREDYLAKLQRLFMRSPELPDHYVRLLPLRVEAIHEVVRGPFEKFPGFFPNEISEELAARITAAVTERSELGFLNLSQVQIVCLRLWRSNRPDELFASAGLEGILSGYLEESLAPLSPAVRSDAILLLTRLVTSAGTRNVVSEDDLLGSAAHGSTDADRLRTALTALTTSSLVRRELRHDAVVYEIVSEFLIPWISRKKEERLSDERRVAERRKRKTAYAAALVAIALAAVVSLAVLLRYGWVTSEARAKELVRNAESARITAESAAAGAQRDLDAARESLRIERRRLTTAEVERNSALVRAGESGRRAQSAEYRQRGSDSLQQASAAKLQDALDTLAVVREQLTQVTRTARELETERRELQARVDSLERRLRIVEQSQLTPGTPSPQR